MKRIALAAALLTMCGTTGCGHHPKIESAGHDPAKLAECPRTVTSPGALPARESFTLPDGRVVVPIANSNARENALTTAALVFRGLWLRCVSSVRYVEDVDAGLSK